jgi:hypothetical protein
VTRDIDSQIQVLESLHEYAALFGEEAPGGVRVSRTCVLDVAIDLDMHAGDVDAMLVRLRRLNLALLLESGAVVLTDVPRLMDFARYIARQLVDQPRQSMVALTDAATEPPTSDASRDTWPDCAESWPQRVETS